MVSSACRPSSAHRSSGTASRTVAGSRPTSSPLSTRHPRASAPRLTASKTSTSGTRAGSTRLQLTWAPEDDRQAEGAQPGPAECGRRARGADLRGRPSGRPVRILGDPHVVGHQHGARADGGGPCRRVGLRRTGVGVEGAEGAAPHLGKGPLGPVEEAGHPERGARPFGEPVTAPWHHHIDVRRSSRVRRAGRTAPRRRPRVAGCTPRWAERSIGVHRGSAATGGAAASTSARAPPRVRTERW